MTDLRVQASPGREVIIVGGGMGGLSAAHELVLANTKLSKRGMEPFRIVILEADGSAAGGKSASQRADEQTFGAPPSGEHGFRLFPKFYRNIIKTRREIPAPASDSSPCQFVASTLGPNDKAVIVLEKKDGSTETRVVKRMSATKNWVEAFEAYFDYFVFFEEAGVTAADAFQMAIKTLTFATACQKRRDIEYDAMSWTDFSGELSEAAKPIVAAITENLSAMRAEHSSARTIGTISLQMAFDFNDSNPITDGSLPGPTTATFIDPWLNWLQDEGVEFERGVRVIDVNLDAANERIDSIEVMGPQGKSRRPLSGSLVLAVPLERAVALIDQELEDWDESLGQLKRKFEETIGTDDSFLGNMAGLQFFLSRSLVQHEGHAAYPHSPWKLTSIAQGRLWTGDLKWIAPRCLDVLSVIVSRWDLGREALSRSEPIKPAKECKSKKEFAREAFKQIGPAWQLDWDRDIIGYHVDDHLQFSADKDVENATPLLVHPVGSHQFRPLASSRATNLFIASDYVRTSTDLASMECANEAARRAVTALMEAAGIDDIIERPQVFELDEWRVFRKLQAIDEWLFGLGRAPLLKYVTPSVDLQGLRGVLKEYMARQNANGLPAAPDDPFVVLVRELGDAAATTDLPGVNPHKLIYKLVLNALEKYLAHGAQS